MRIQRGKDKLLEPASATDAAMEFEFEISVDIETAIPNFLGEFAQGPKSARFVYVNSGTYAGQLQTCWSRRAKLSLMSISEEQIKAVINDTSTCIETEMPGVGRDGGPTCASVKGIEWRVVKK